MAEDDAIVWRLASRGWAVRTGTRMLVFDADVTSDDLEKYKEDLDYLAGFTDRVDIAFLPAADFDPSRESDLALFVERFSPRTIILLHADDHGGTHEAVTEWAKKRGLEIPVLQAEYPGDHFEFRRRGN